MHLANYRNLMSPISSFDQLNFDWDILAPPASAQCGDSGISLLPAHNICFWRYPAINGVMLAIARVYQKD